MHQNDGEDHPLLTESAEVENSDKKAISFMTALKIPGVIEFSLCLFFAKLVSYTVSDCSQPRRPFSSFILQFLYWLPKYIGASSNYNIVNVAAVY